jgi:hypothetical protein
MVGRVVPDLGGLASRPGPVLQKLRRPLSLSHSGSSTRSRFGLRWDGIEYHSGKEPRTGQGRFKPDHGFGLTSQSDRSKSLTINQQRQRKPGSVHRRRRPLGFLRVYNLDRLHQNYGVGESVRPCYYDYASWFDQMSSFGGFVPLLVSYIVIKEFRCRSDLADLS